MDRERSLKSIAISALKSESAKLRLRVNNEYRRVDGVAAQKRCHAKLGMNQNRLFSLCDHTFKS